MIGSINWDELPEHQIVEGLYGKFFHTTTMSVVLWRFEAGADLPLHHHPHEQITMIQEGKLQLTVDGETMILGPGDTLLIASNLEHGGKAVEATLAFDIFHPVREDFKEKFG